MIGDFFEGVLGLMRELERESEWQMRRRIALERIESEERLMTECPTQTNKKREMLITKDDVCNLKIALETIDTVEDFLEKI